MDMDMDKDMDMDMDINGRKNIMDETKSVKFAGNLEWKTNT